MELMLFAAFISTIFHLVGIVTCIIVSVSILKG